MVQGQPPNGGGRAYMPIGAPGGKFMPGQKNDPALTMHNRRPKNPLRRTNLRKCGEQAHGQRRSSNLM
eukprot:5083502-Amphidinium_carterae.1